MSVLELKLTDALADEKLDIQFQESWSRLRSGRSGIEIFAYSVISDSGHMYECEVFMSDVGTICGYCQCPSRVICRHRKAVLANVLKNNPEFGKSVRGEENHVR